MSNHLISVIVPVYNVEPYLRQCLDSIVNQTYPNIEILIVDDGSPDHCGEICDEYAKKDSRIIVIHQENAGLSAARNAALDIARGEYIMFVDSDDWVEPTFCEKALEMVIEHQVELVCFGFKKIFQKEHKEIRTNNPRLLDRAEAINHIILYDEPSLYNIVWNKIYHKKLFQTLRFPIGMVCEDNAITYKLIHQSLFIYISDLLLYNYNRIRNDSITSKKNSKKPKITIDLFLIRYERLLFLKKYYPQFVENQIIELAKMAICRYGLLHNNMEKEKQMREIMLNYLKDNKSIILLNTNDIFIRFCLHSKKTLSLFGEIILLRHKLSLFFQGLQGRQQTQDLLLQRPHIRR